MAYVQVRSCCRNFALQNLWLNSPLFPGSRQALGLGVDAAQLGPEGVKQSLASPATI